MYRKFEIMFVLLCIIILIPLIKCEENFGSASLRSLKASSFMCNSDGDCSGQGTCSNGACQCNTQYANVDCSVLKKSQGVAFILSFFFGPWGGDRLYLGYIGLGVFKIIVTLFVCTLPFIPVLIVHLLDKDSEFAGYMTAVSFCMTVFAVLIWWLVDWILIVSGNMLDSNGFELNMDFTN